MYQNMLRLAMLESCIMGVAICAVAPLWRALQMVRAAPASESSAPFQVFLSEL